VKDIAIVVIVMVVVHVGSRKEDIIRKRMEGIYKTGF
jgi:hypothetical protein